MLASVSLFGSAYAGSLGVSGTAKATYNITSGNNTSQGKGLGITNELNFTASGELDNGYTWSYSMELDPADGQGAGGAATNDDNAIKLTTPYGTVGMFILEGGLTQKMRHHNQYTQDQLMQVTLLMVRTITIQLTRTITYNTTHQLIYYHLV